MTAVSLSLTPTCPADPAAIAVLAHATAAASAASAAAFVRAPGDDGTADPFALEIGWGALLRFRSLMAAAGHAVQLARLVDDPAYAYDRFALAHAASDPVLRRLALELFQIHHRRRTAARATQ